MAEKSQSPDKTGLEKSGSEQQARKAISPQAKRALEEAEERRAQAESDKQTRSAEVGGRDGPDPVRYGDWESKGITSDF